MRRRLYGGILTGALIGVIALAVVLVVIVTGKDDRGPSDYNAGTQTENEDKNDADKNQGTNEDVNNNGSDDNNGSNENEGTNGNTGSNENEGTNGNTGSTGNEGTNGNTGSNENEGANGNTGSDEEDAEAINEKIAKLAIAQIGKGYEWGEEGPDNFDASGLIYYCYVQNGISIPRTIKEMATHGKEVDENNLKPGDVVFFYNDTPGTPQFVGLYVGEGKVIIVSSAADAVKEISVTSEYYQVRFVSARRFW